MCKPAFVNQPTLCAGREYRSTIYICMNRPELQNSCIPWYAHVYKVHAWSSWHHFGAFIKCLSVRLGLALQAMHCMLWEEDEGRRQKRTRGRAACVHDGGWVGRWGNGQLFSKCPSQTKRLFACDPRRQSMRDVFAWFFFFFSILDFVLLLFVWIYLWLNRFIYQSLLAWNFSFCSKVTLSVVSYMWGLLKDWN